MIQLAISTKTYSSKTGGGAKCTKNFIQRLLAISICMAMVLCTVPLRKYNYDVHAADNVVIVTFTAEETINAKENPTFITKVSPDLASIPEGTLVKFECAGVTPFSISLADIPMYFATGVPFVWQAPWSRLALNVSVPGTEMEPVFLPETPANMIVASCSCGDTDEPDALNLRDSNPAYAANGLAVLFIRCATDGEVHFGPHAFQAEVLDFAYTKSYGQKVGEVNRDTVGLVWLPPETHLCGATCMQVKGAVSEAVSLSLLGLDHYSAKKCAACQHWETLGNDWERDGITMRTDEATGTTYTRIQGHDVNFIYDKNGVNGSDGIWFGVDNSRGIFPDGSILHLQWLKKGDPGFDEKLQELLDKSTLSVVDPNKLSLLDIAVTGTDGQPISQWDGTVECYFVVPAGWKEEDMRSTFLATGVDESVEEIRFEDMFIPGSDEPVRVMVLPLKHFSLYAVYDKLTESEKANNKNVKTGDAVTNVTIAGLGMILVLAIGVMLRLITKKNRS